jgi:hypothetical protein
MEFANWFFALFHLNVFVLAGLVTLSAGRRWLKWVGRVITVCAFLVAIGPWFRLPGGSTILLALKSAVLGGGLLLLAFSPHTDTRLVALMLTALAGVTPGFQVWPG